MTGIILLVILVVIAVVLISMYNTLVQLRVRCDSRSEEHTSELQSP